MNKIPRLPLMLVFLILAIPGYFCSNATDIADVGSLSITESGDSSLFSGHTTPVASQTTRDLVDSSSTPHLVKCDIQISGNQDMIDMLDAVISKTIVTILGILAIAINVVWLAVVLFLRLRSKARKRHRRSDISSDSRLSDSLGLSADDQQQCLTNEPTGTLSVAGTHCSSTEQKTTPKRLCNGADDDVEMALSPGEAYPILCNDHNSNIKAESDFEESLTMNGGKLAVEPQSLEESPLPSLEGVEFFDLSICCEDSSTQMHDQCSIKSPSLKFDPTIFNFT